MTDAKPKRSRGPSKIGKVPLTIHLSNDDYQKLVVAAENEFRSPTQQAAWIIMNILDRGHMPDGD